MGRVESSVPSCFLPCQETLKGPTKHQSMPLPLARQTLAPQHSRPASTRKTKQYGPHTPQTESRNKEKPTRNFHQEATSSKTQESCGEKMGSCY